MSEQDGLGPELAALSAALKSLAPSPARVDPIAAAFAAGRRTARKSLRVWQTIAAGIILTGGATWIISLRHNATNSVPLAPAIAVSIDQSGRAQPPSQQSWQAMQMAVSQGGIDALPKSDIPSSNAINITNSSMQ